MAIALAQDKVNELVNRFYEKLLNDTYYVSMFNERNVDIELLKGRQRVFINRLLIEENSQEHDSQVTQVKERHSFQIAPGRAEIWFGMMKETIGEMELDDHVKEQLINKIKFLLEKMI
jgi:truncated hemoglobin YjbI